MWVTHRLNMKIPVSVILWFVHLNSIGQSESTRNWVDSEVKYTDSKGNSVAFTHSFPRGGGVVQKDGEKYPYFIFWTRVFNQSDTPVELKVQFPEVAFFRSPESYLHIVLPKEKMSLDKVQVFDYGLTDLQAIFNDESNQLGVLQKKIQPNEDCIFYTAVFIHMEGSGSARAKFEWKDKELFYKIAIGSDGAVIPCGSLQFIN